jgi:hypothetical protein
MNDFKDPNETMKCIIEKYRSDFFKTSILSDIRNTNKSVIQLKPCKFD